MSAAWSNETFSAGGTTVEDLIASVVGGRFCAAVAEADATGAVELKRFAALCWIIGLDRNIVGLVEILEVNPLGFTSRDTAEDWTL
jgi:hypothetical protein